MEILIILCLLCCVVSYAASVAMERFWPNSGPTARLLLATALPTVLYVLALVAWHVAWRASGGQGYSPLVFLIYGWWFVWLNLGASFIAAATRWVKR